MSKVDDLEEEVNAIKNKIAIDEGVKKGIKVHCIAVWSIISTLTMGFGSLIANYSDAVYAGAKAFWVVFMGKHQ